MRAHLGTPLLLAAAMMTLGCGTKANHLLTAKVYESPNQVVRLQAIPDANKGRGYTHPAYLAQERVAKVLEGLRVDKNMSPIPLAFQRGVDKTATVPAFTEAEVKFFAPLLTKGLAKATPREVVTFYETADINKTQTDVEFHERPAGSIAWAGATNIGKCTRWSSNGCDTLNSLTSLGQSYTPDSIAADGQFRDDQQMVELAFKWRGFSLQSEYHWKQIKDAGRSPIPAIGFAGALPSKTNLMGSYVQGGYFFHYLWNKIPKPMELAFRYGFVDPNVFVSGDKRQEFTPVINWFLAGHRNKLTL